MNSYTVQRLAEIPTSPLDPRWDALPTVALDRFHARSSAHRPVVRAQLGHSGDHLHLRFTVHDRHVLSRITKPNGPVCSDSCVELFIEPVPGLGYFNLEMNAGGTAMCGYVTDPTRVNGVIRGLALLSEAELARIAIATTLPAAVIEPERPGLLDWAICARVPIDLFAARLGVRPPVPGRWRGNFYKCADECSQPHWASWMPVGEVLSFHAPDRFGSLELV